MRDEAEDALEFLLRTVTAERAELYRYQGRPTEGNRRRWEAASEAMGAAKYRSRTLLDERRRSLREEMWGSVLKAQP
jgi:hypothetical protein